MKKRIYYVVIVISMIAVGFFFWPATGEEVLPAEYHDFTINPDECKEFKTVMSFSGEEIEFVGQVMDSLVIVEGDIILGSVNELEQFGLAVRTGEGKLWDDGLVPFVIPSNHPNIKAIEKAIKELNLETNIRLINRTLESDYLYFHKSNGYSSYVGKRGGKQYVNIGGSSIPSIKHEIIHAIGFYHEQSRTDRDEYIKINLRNVKKSSRHNFKKYIQRRGHSGIDIGPYDYNSIMHYSSYAFAKRKKKKTIEVRMPPASQNTTIGQRKKLSSGDIKSINLVYPKILQ